MTKIIFALSSNTYTLSVFCLVSGFSYLVILKLTCLASESGFEVFDTLELYFYGETMTETGFVRFSQIDDNELIFCYFLYFQRCIFCVGVITATPQYSISCEMISSQFGCQTLYRKTKLSKLFIETRLTIYRPILIGHDFRA